MELSKELSKEIESYKDLIEDLKDDNDAKVVFLLLLNLLLTPFLILKSSAKGKSFFFLYFRSICSILFFSIHSLSLNSLSHFLSRSLCSQP